MFTERRAHKRNIRNEGKVLSLNELVAKLWLVRLADVTWWLVPRPRSSRESQEPHALRGAQTIHLEKDSWDPQDGALPQIPNYAGTKVLILMGKMVLKS